jgi:hypothetical protein
LWICYKALVLFIRSILSSVYPELETNWNLAWAIEEKLIIKSTGLIYSSDRIVLKVTNRIAGNLAVLITIYTLSKQNFD